MADLTISVELDGSKVKGGADETNRAVRSVADEAEKAAKKTSSLAKVDYSGAIRQLKEYGDKIKNVGSQISGYGQRLTLGLSAPIAAIATLGIKFNATKEQAITAFSVLLKNGEAAKKLYAELQDFADKTPFESPEVVESGRKLLAAKVPLEEIKGYLTDIGDLAAGTGQNITEVASAFTRIKAGDFGEAFERLRDFGIARKDLEAEGLKFDKGGQYLGSVEQAMKAVRAIVQRDFGGMMDEQSKTFSGRLSTIWDTINRAAGDLFEPMFDKIREGLPIVIDFVTQVKDFFGGLSEPAKLAVTAFLAILAAIGPLLVVLGTLITFVGSVVGAVATLVPIFATVGGAIVSLGGFIISFIGLIGSAGLAASLTGLAVALSEVIIPAVGAFLAALVPITAGVVAVVAVIGVLIGVGAALFAAYQTNFGGLRDLVNDVFNGIVGVIQSALQSIQDFWTTYGAQIISTATETFNSIVEFLRPIMTEIVATVREAWQMLVEVAGPLFAQIVTIVKTHLTALMQIVQVVLASIVAFWSEHGDQIKAVVSSIWTILKTIVIGGIRQIANVITLILAVINGDWAGAWNALKQIVQAGVNATATIFKSLGNLILNALGFLAQRLFGIGKDVIQGFINGIKSGAASLYETATSLATGVISIFRNVPIVRSPSKVTTEIGEFIAEGLAVGIENKSARVLSAAKKLADGVIKQFRDAQKEFSKLAGASPEVQQTIQQTNQTSDATSAQQEIIKLRADLGVNTDLALPSNVAGTMAELKYLQEKKKLIEDTIPAHEKLAKISKEFYEELAKEKEKFDNLKDSITESGARELLQAQKEFDLLGVTDVVEKQRIENAYELLELRMKMTSDGYGTAQIEEAAKLLQIEQSRTLEFIRMKQIKQQEIDLDKKIRDEQLKEAEEAKKRFEKSATALAGSLQRIFGAGVKEGFKGFLKQTLEELKNFGTSLVNNVLSQLAKSLSKFILEKLGGGGSSGGGGLGGFLSNLLGGGNSGGSSGGGGFFNIIRNLSGGSGGSSGSTGVGSSHGSSAGPGGGGGIGLSGGLALGGMAATLLGGLIGGRAGGFISGVGQGVSIGAMFGPWGALAGGAIGGIVSLFGGDPKRKRDKNEKLPALNQGFADALAQLRALGADKNAFYANPEETIAKAVELRGQIASGFGITFESKKYRAQAQQLIAAKLGEADGIIQELQRLKNRALRARDVDSKLQTSFATGVYLGRDDQMRDMQSGLDFKRRNGMLAGAWSGKDSLPSMLAKGEMVLNPFQIQRVILNAGNDPFKNAGIPGYANGAYIAPSPSAPSPVASSSPVSASSSQSMKITLVLEGDDATVSKIKFKEALVDNLKKDDVQVELVKAVDKGRSRS